MSDKKNHIGNIEFLIFVILTLVFIFSIIVFLEIPPTVTGNKLNDLLLALIPNIIASILTFSVAYYIFSIRGIKLRDSTNDEITQKLDNLISIERSNLRFRTSEYDSIDELFKNILYNKPTSIEMVGYSMAHVFQRYRKEIIKFIAEGAKVRVLILDPESTAGQLMTENVGDKSLVEEPHLRTLRYINNINLELQKIENAHPIQVKKMPWVPSCTIIMAHNNISFFSILLGINGFVVDNSIDRRIYTVSNLDVRDDKFRFFEAHFTGLWNKIKVVSK